MSIENAITQIVRNNFYLKLLPLLTLITLAIFLYLFWKQRKLLLNLYPGNKTFKILTGIFTLALFLRFFGNYIGTHPEYIYTAIANTIYRTGKYGICLHQAYCFPSYKPYTLYPTLLAGIYHLIQKPSFMAARALNVVFGSLTIIGGAIFVKVHSSKGSDVIFYPLLLALFPLHIIFSGAMETHIVALFFMLLCLAFLWMSKENIEFLSLALFSGILAVLGKVFHIVLVIPIIFIIWNKRKAIIENLEIQTAILAAILISVFFFPIYYLFLFIHDVAVVQGVGISPSLYNLFNYLAFHPYSLSLVIISLLGILICLYKRENMGIIALTLIYSLPILTHQRGPMRIWMPVLVFLLFFGSKFISYLTNLVSNLLRLEKIKVIFVVSIVLLASFFISIDFRKNYVFNSESKLRDRVNTLSQIGDIYSKRADLLSSLTEVPLYNRNYAEGQNISGEKPIIFVSGQCKKVEGYILTNTRGVDEEFKFCLYESK